jgi:DNA-binding transcriptional LysR family regulator
MYNLEQLRVFVEVAQSGSFSACARKLGKVQSSVSQGIANLEIDLDVPLFDRRTRKPSLTVQGEHLLVYAKAILQQTYEFDSALKSLHQHHETELVLAIDDALMTSVLEKVLLRFAMQFATTTLSIHAVTSSDVVELVRSGGADLGLMFSDMQFPEGIDLCYLGDLPFYAVVSPKHPLAGHPKVSAADLIPYRQLMIKGDEQSVSAQIPAISAQIWKGNNFSLLADLVSLDFGWSYIPSHLVEKGIASGNLCQLKLSFDHKPWRVPVERIMSKNKATGPALTWLANELTRLFEG